MFGNMFICGAPYNSMHLSCKVEEGVQPSSCVSYIPSYQVSKSIILRVQLRSKASHLPTWAVVNIVPNAYFMKHGLAQVSKNS